MLPFFPSSPGCQQFDEQKFVNALCFALRFFAGHWLASPDGEIGRHIGLKIRRLLKRRAGSIPARGTKSTCHVYCMAGFLFLYF